MTDRSPVFGAAALVLFGLLGAVLVTLAWHQTAEPIEINERNYRLRVLNEIVPASRYDNALFDDSTSAFDPELLGSNEPVTAYRARKAGAPVAVILPVVAARGYSGAIHMLVGINADGTIAGVRVSSHRETAGLGDNINIDRSQWILGFDNRSLRDPPPAQWLVRKDGGQFDQFTGATITPRAVVKAVHNALLYFEANRNRLFEEPIGKPEA